MSNHSSDVESSLGEDIMAHSQGMNEEEIEKAPADTKQAAASTTTAAATVRPNPFNSDNKHLSTIFWVMLVVSVSSASFLYGFDLVIIANLQPSIIRELGEIEKLPWITTSYLLSCTGTLLLWGRIYAHFNVKWVFIAAMLLFNAGSAVTGSALNMNMFIGGRTLNGIGAIGIYTGSLNVITSITTIRQRTLYISFSTLAYSISSVIAPLIGGAFADSSPGWRWGFYINICFSAGFAPAYIFLLPSKTFSSNAKSLRERVRQFDLIGNGLWACATSTLLTAISFGGALYPWSNGRIIGLFAASGVTWVVFVVQQWRGTENARSCHAFPVHLVQSWETCNLWLQTFCANAAAFVPLTLIPLYFQFARGTSALSAGLHLLPLVIGRMSSSFANGLFMRKYGYVMPWYLAGSAMTLASSAPFLIFDVSTPASAIYGCTFVIGFGSGLYLQSSFAVAQARSPANLVQKAITFVNLGQIMGVAFPVTTSSSIFINVAVRLIKKVVPDITSQTLQEAIVAISSNNLLTDGLNEQQKSRVTHALITALQNAWAIVVAAAGLSLLCSFFITRERLWK